MAESEYREYLINANAVEEKMSDILDSMKVELAQRAGVLLTISAMIDGVPTTTDVRFIPTVVDYDDKFISRGRIKDDNTEASIKSEADGMYLVMDTAIDHSADDSEHLTTTG